MDIKIDAEAINKHLSDSIMKSVLGPNISKAIDTAVTESISGYSSPLKKLVNDALTQEIVKRLNEDDAKKALAEEVTKFLQEESVKKFLQNIIEKFVKELRDNRY